MRKRSKRSVYVNAKQAAFLQATQKRRTFVGGRGSGKSTVLGHQTRLEFNYLPRAKVFLAGLTYNQIQTKTLPSAMDAWAQHGLEEYDPKTKLGHYVVMRRPPPGWVKPYQAPRNYENTITFLNGYTIEMLSLDRADTARGGNYDGGHIDESALIKREIVAKVLRPMIRGNRERFTHPLHQIFCDYTSAPWLVAGQWVYETEELTKTEPEKYFFLESTAYDNIDVLGEDYLDNLRAGMSVLEYDVEVMNKRLAKLPNCFYPAFDDTRHCRFDTFSYQYDDRTGLHLPSLRDVDPNRALEISWDFNAAFTSLIVCQEHYPEFRVLNALFVKEAPTGNVVEAAVDKFCEEYADHSKKEVAIYGDRNGNNRSPGSTLTFYQQIMERLTQKGWKCALMVQGLDPDHRLKHHVINALLAETDSRKPIIRLNGNTCKFLAISIKLSPILPDFRKDKRSESTMVDQEKATHFSDCFDNIVYRKYAHLFAGNTAPNYQVYFLGQR